MLLLVESEWVKGDRMRMTMIGTDDWNGMLVILGVIEPGKGRVRV